ncbi:ML domain-containing protein [Pilaira anomala]|nr:ML domain-containing protein [Pilaira anomala]
MKFLACTVSLIFILFSNIVLAGLVSWSSQSYKPSYYLNRAGKSNVWIKDCSSSNYVLHIDNIKITPDFVTPGAELTIEASGTLDETVLPGATANVIVKLGVVTLLKKKFDICDELQKKEDEIALQCPINQGYLALIQKVSLPKEIPKGKFRVLVNAYTADENDLACLDVTVDFRAHPSNRFLQLAESD